MKTGNTFNKDLAHCKQTPNTAQTITYGNITVAPPQKSTYKPQIGEQDNYMQQPPQSELIRILESQKSGNTLRGWSPKSFKQKGVWTSTPQQSREEVMATPKSDHRNSQITTEQDGSSRLGLGPIMQQLRPVPKFDVALQQKNNEQPFMLQAQDQSNRIRGILKSKQAARTDIQEYLHNTMINEKYQSLQAVKNMRKFSLQKGDVHPKLEKDYKLGGVERNMQDLSITAKGYKTINPKVVFNQRSLSLSNNTNQYTEKTHDTKKISRDTQRAHRNKSKAETTPMLEKLHDKPAMQNLKAVTAEMLKQIRLKQQNRKAVTPVVPFKPGQEPARNNTNVPTARLKNKYHIKLAQVNQVPETQDYRRQDTDRRKSSMNNSALSGPHSQRTQTNQVNQSTQINNQVAAHQPGNAVVSSGEKKLNTGQKELPVFQKQKLNNIEKFRQFQIINEQQSVNNMLNQRSQNRTALNAYSGRQLVDQPHVYINSSELKIFQEQYQQYLQDMASDALISSMQSNQSPKIVTKSTNHISSEQGKNEFIQIIQGLQAQSLKIQQMNKQQQKPDPTLTNNNDHTRSIGSSGSGESTGPKNVVEKKLQQKYQEHARQALTAFVMSESQRAPNRSNHNTPPLPLGAILPSKVNRLPQQFSPTHQRNEAYDNLMQTGEHTIKSNEIIQNIMRTRTLSTISDNKKIINPAQISSLTKPLKLSSGGEEVPKPVLSKTQSNRNGQVTDLHFKEPIQSKQVIQLNPIQIHHADNAQKEPTERTRVYQQSNDAKSYANTTNSNPKSLKIHYQMSNELGIQPESKSIQIKQIEVFPKNNNEDAINTVNTHTRCFSKEEERLEQQLSKSSVKIKINAHHTKIESGETKLNVQEEIKSGKNTDKSTQSIQTTNELNPGVIAKVVSMTKITKDIQSQETIKQLTEIEDSSQQQQSQFYSTQKEMNMNFNPRMVASFNATHVQQQNKRNTRIDDIPKRGGTALLTDDEYNSLLHSSQLNGLNGNEMPSPLKIKEPKFPQIEIQSKKSNLSSTQNEGVIIIEGNNVGASTSLNEIGADGLSLSGGETQTNLLQPTYYLQHQKKKMNQFGGLNVVPILGPKQNFQQFKDKQFYVQQFSNSNDILTDQAMTSDNPSLVNVQPRPSNPLAVDVATPQQTQQQNQLNVKNMSAIEKEKINRILLLNTNQNNNQFQLAVNKFDKSNKKRPFKSTNKDISGEKGENKQKLPNPFALDSEELRSSLQQRPFIAPLGSFPEDKRYMKTIQDITTQVTNKQQVYQFNQMKYGFPNIDLSQIEQRQIKARTPYSVAREENPLMQRRDINKLQDKNQHPATAYDQRRFKRNRNTPTPIISGAPSRIANQNSNDYSVSFNSHNADVLNSSNMNSFSITPRTVRCNLGQSNINSLQQSYDTQKKPSNSPRHFKSTISEENEYLKNLLNMFLKENQNLSIEGKGKQWPSRETPRPVDVEGILEPNWKNFCWEQSLLKRGVPIETLLGPKADSNNYKYDSKAFVLYSDNNLSDRNPKPSPRKTSNTFDKSIRTDNDKDTLDRGELDHKSLTSRSGKFTSQVTNDSVVMNRTMKPIQDNISIVDYNTKDHQGYQQSFRAESKSIEKAQISQISKISGEKQPYLDTERLVKNSFDVDKSGGGDTSRIEPSVDRSLKIEHRRSSQPKQSSRSPRSPRYPKPYEFRLINYRQQDKLSKQKDNIQNIKPIVQQAPKMDKIKASPERKNENTKTNNTKTMNNKEIDAHAPEVQQAVNDSFLNLQISQTDNDYSYTTKMKSTLSRHLPDREQVKSSLIEETPRSRSNLVRSTTTQNQQNDTQNLNSLDDSSMPKAQEATEGRGSNRSDSMSNKKIIIKHKKTASVDSQSSPSPANQSQKALKVEEKQNPQERERIIVGGNLDQRHQTAKIPSSRNNISQQQSGQNGNLGVCKVETEYNQKDNAATSFDITEFAKQTFDCKEDVGQGVASSILQDESVTVGQNTDRSYIIKTIENFPNSKTERSEYKEKRVKEIQFPNSGPDNRLKSDGKKTAAKHGKIVSIRGNPNKQWMTNTTKDGRKFTQSLVRPLILEEIEIRKRNQTKHQINMDMIGFGVGDLNLKSLTDRTRIGFNRGSDKPLSRGSLISHMSRKTRREDAISPLSPRFGPQELEPFNYRNHANTKAHSPGESNRNLTGGDEAKDTRRQALQTEGAKRSKQKKQTQMSKEIENNNSVSKQQSEHHESKKITTGKISPNIEVSQSPLSPQSPLSAITPTQQASVRDRDKSDVQSKFRDISKWRNDTPQHEGINIQEAHDQDPQGEVLTHKKSIETKEGEFEIITCKKSQGTKDGEYSKSSKGNRQLVHLKRGINIQKKSSTVEGTQTTADFIKNDMQPDIIINKEQNVNSEGNLSDIQSDNFGNPYIQYPTIESNDDNDSPKHIQEQDYNLNYNQDEESFIQDIIQIHHNINTVQFQRLNAKNIQTDKNYPKAAKYSYKCKLDIDDMLTKALKKSNDNKETDKSEAGRTSQTQTAKSSVCGKQVYESITQANGISYLDVVKLRGHAQKHFSDLPSLKSPTASTQPFNLPQVMQVSRVIHTKGNNAKIEIMAMPESPLQRNPTLKHKKTRNDTERGNLHSPESRLATSTQFKNSNEMGMGSK